jgi:hypothetical protein
MNRTSLRLLPLFWISLSLLLSTYSISLYAQVTQTGQQPLGIFEGHSDVGAVLHPGSAVYDPTRKT